MLAVQWLGYARSGTYKVGGCWCAAWRVQDVKAYAKLRVERMNARLAGMRAKKARDAAKEAENNS
jgi:hypothetical protein